MTTNNGHLPRAIAQRLNAGGISTIPLKRDGTKSPAVATWKQYQDRLPTTDEIDQLFSRSSGIAAICGRVSGDMEAIDFDDASTFAEWQRIVKEGQSGLTARLSICQTPRPGYHVRYRCPGHIGGCQKLALLPNGKTRIEIKGEGGYVVAEGSPANVHENNTPYVHHSGPPLTDLQDVTAEERNLMLSVARMFDQSPKQETHRPAMPANGSGVRPGDEYNRSPLVTWESILEPHGWTFVGESEGRKLWRRPGKSYGTSATTGHCSSDGVDLLAVFSSNAHPFPGPSAGRLCSCHSKFDAYTLLNFGERQHSAAARALAAERFGKPSNGQTNGTNHKQSPPADDSPNDDRRPNGFVYAPIDSKTFASGDYRPTWLVKRLLVAKQPCIVGAPRKSLKTSTMTDLAISLATGSPFLGTFDVYRHVRVAFLSGESGESATQSIALRVCASKGINLAEVPVLWSFTLPRLSNDIDVGNMVHGFKGRAVEVAIVDPLYLCLTSGGDADAKNLFDIGPLLLKIAKACLDIGVTPILVHHARKNLIGDRYSPLELEDLAFAGSQEFARQWLTLNRREPYDANSPGVHRMWMTAGGSIGHGGLWAVDVEEGELKDDFSGRRWDVHVMTGQQAISDAKERESQAADDARRAVEFQQENAVMGALDSLDPKYQGIDRKTLMGKSGLSERKFDATLQRLASLVEAVPVTKIVGNGAKVKCQGCRRRGEK